MREEALLRCDGGGARVASGRGVATVLRGEAAMAWAPEGRSGGSGWRVAEERTGLDALERGGASGYGVATVLRSEAAMTWARWKNDNYGGGDDNYPRVVVETGRRDERKDVAGTGRNSCR